MEERKNIRLREYDYGSNGYYFVTLCTKDKKCILWNTRMSYNGKNNHKTDTCNVGETTGLPYR